MPTPPLSKEVVEETLRAYEACNGNKSKAAEALGITRSTFRSRLERVELARIEASQAKFTIDQSKVEGEKAAEPVVNLELLKKALRSGRFSLQGLATNQKVPVEKVQAAINELRQQHFSIHESNGAIWLDTSPQSGVYRGGSQYEYKSREDGSYLFGFTSDNHLGSKYSRLDVLHELYDKFAEVGVDRVFNAGNWIDGEAPFNKHDLVVRGLDSQCRYLAREWPRKEGIVTYAVTGDDHEGWYSQREGVDMGRYAENCFADEERSDWVDLGYMEADIALVHAKSGIRSRLRVAHPGGGSAYATSYAPQKYIESLDGGEKPHIVLLGHWHKMEMLNVRNVWTIQTGCTQDQTPFGRKKRLDFHVGGGICRVKQDPDTGAIISCAVEFMRFFNKAHYGSGRWSHHQNVTMAERSRT